MKNCVYVILIMLFFSMICHAQVAEYYFTQQNLSYTEITGGTPLWSGTFDNEVSGEITIPSFTFNGTVYTSLYVSANGFVTFGAAPAGTNYTPISNSATYNGAVSGFGRDLNQAAGGTPEIRYEQVGNEFVVQWKDVRRKDIASEVISLQLRLNTSNNYISVVYGGTITPGLNTTYPQVGLRGPDNTFVTNVNNRTIAAAGGNWINSTKGTSNSSTMYFSSTTATTVPTAGLTYTWKPLYNPLNFTATGISLSQIDLNWQKNSLDQNVMLAYSTSATFGTPVSGQLYSAGNTITGGGIVLFYGNGTSFSHSSLNPSTVYYYKLWSYDAFPDYSPGVTASTRTAYALPYLQAFPTSSLPAEWLSDMSRSNEHGTSGTYGLYKRLYPSVTTCYATAPLAGNITANTYLSFHYRFVDYLGFPYIATTLGGNDKVEIQVSTDDGVTFTTFHTIDYTNHTESTEFTNKVISLAAYDGDFIRIKFLCTWESGDYYVDIDNVLIEDGTNMSYTSNTVVQPNITNVAINSTDNDIIRLEVITQKSSNPLSVTSITFNTTGCTNAGTDLAAAKVFFTTTPVFSTSTQFGSTLNNPSGTITITGSQALAQGNNYFWLAYDIKATATLTNVVDGQCTKFITSESGTEKLTNITAITGNRKIGDVINGVKSIPGNYASIAAAVTSLNNSVIGPDGVTVNVAAGHTENITAPIVLTATGSSSQPIVFQKSGAGSNPIVTHTGAGTVTTSLIGNHGDGVIIIEGSDYVTFDSINVATSNQGVEYGYYFRKASVTNACKNVTVKNVVITMTTGTSRFVAGICAANNLAASSNAGILSPGGRHENIIITGNTITSAFTGIYLKGSPDFKDQDFIIGANGVGNTIQKFGGGLAFETWGIYLVNNNNSLVKYNTVNNMSGGGSAFGSVATGIYHASTDEDSFTAEYNNINLTSVSYQLYGIYNSSMGLLNLNNNTVALSNTASSSAVYAFIYNNQTYTSTTSDSYISNNTFAACNFQTTGLTYMIRNSNNKLNPSVSYIQNNLTTGTINRTGASGTFYIYYNDNGTGTGTENISGNNFSNIVLAGVTSFYGVYSATDADHTQNIYDNTISNITGGNGNFYAIYVTTANNRAIYGNQIFNITGGGIIDGVYLGNGSNPGHIYKNEIYNLSSSLATIEAGAVNGILAAAGTNVYIYNNFISDLKAPALTSYDGIRGIAIVPGQSNGSIGIYYNTIYLNATSSGVNFGTTGIYHIANTSATFALLDLRNNLIINNSTPNGSASTVAFRRTAQTTANYAANSNNNIFYAGTPASNRLIYVGNTTKQTIEEYRDFMGPNRDSVSFSELPPFVNISTAPYDLRLQDGTTSYCESGAQTITAPLTISDDFDGAARPSKPDIGADEFAGIAAYVEFPSSLIASILNSQQVSLAFISNPDNDDVVIVYNSTGIFSLPSGLPLAGDPLAGGTVVYVGDESPEVHSGLTPGAVAYYKAFCYNGANYSLGIIANATPTVTPVTNLSAVPDFQSIINLGWTKNIYDHDVMVAGHSAYMNGIPVNGTSYNVGDPLPVSGTIIYKGPASGFSHTGLESWSQHYYKVWSVDIYNYYSSGVTTNAITDADPVATFPCLQNFDGTWSHSPQAPPEWLVVDVGGSGSFTWIRNSTFEKSTPYCVQGYGNGVQNDYLISPPLDLPDTLVQLTWWDKVSVSTNINNYKVLLSTTNNFVSSFTTELMDITCSNTNWQQYTLNLSAYKGQTIYIAFYHYFTTQQYQTFAIDDIIIETNIPGAASAVFPEDEMLTMIDQTLKWNAPAATIPILGYKVYMDTNPNPATLVYNGPDLSFQTALLDHNTTYYWKVIPYNSNGEAYNVPVWSFSTVTSTQLAQSFEADYFPPVSWQAPNGGWFISTASTYHGSQSANRYTYNTIRPKLITPLLDIEVGDKLEFVEGTASKINNYMVVCYSADKIDWDTIGDILDITIGSWGHRSFDLSALAGNQYYFAFEVWCAPGSYNAYVYIDHVIGPDVVPILPWAATNPEPFNGDDFLPLNLVLYWAPQIWGGIPSGYKVYLDDNPDPTTLLYDGISEFCQAGPLELNTTYYWKVVPYNSLGDALDCMVWSFTTVPVGGVQIGRDLTDYYDLPVYTDYSYNYSQTIYLQSEINISGKRISKIYYLWNGVEDGDLYKDWVVYMGHTTKTEFNSYTDWVPLAQMTQVFAGEVIIPYNNYESVWVEIVLDIPFDYNNTDNLVIAVDENTDGYSYAYNASFYITETPAYRSIQYYSDDDNPDPASPPEADYYSQAIPNLRLLLEGSPVTPIFFCNPSFKNFGTVNIFESSGIKTFSIRNRGIGSLTITGTMLSGPDNDHFQRTDNNLYPVTLLTNEAITVTISFNPYNEGVKNASLVIFHDQPGSPGVVPLTGECFDPRINTFPFLETFEDYSPTLYSWTQILENGYSFWDMLSGNYGSITEAYNGIINAGYDGFTDDSTMYVCPMLNLSLVTDPQLSFWYGNEAYELVGNNFRVYYRTDPYLPWVEIFFDNSNVAVWTEVTLVLPDPSPAYQIAFEAATKEGYPVVIDNVRVGSPPAPQTIWTGMVSTDWTDPDNWSDGVPTVDHAVYIATEMYDPVIETTVTVFSIDLDEYSTLLVSPPGSLTVTGN